MKHVREVGIGVLLGVACLTVFSGCSAVKSAASVVPGASYVPGLADDKSDGPQVGEKLHFKISPDEALEILAEVAPAHEWELDAVGEQYDLEGLRGKYFKLRSFKFLLGFCRSRFCFDRCSKRRD